MKKGFLVLGLILLLCTASAEKITYNASDAPDYNSGDSQSQSGPDAQNQSDDQNQSGTQSGGDDSAQNPADAGSGENKSAELIPGLDINLSEINLSEAGEKLRNATTTGYEPIDSSLRFLIDASPFLLLIIGILVFIFAGFAKLIGILIIIIALIRLLQIIFLS